MGKSVPDHLYREKEKRTTTTPLPLSEIPKKLINAFPPALQVKPILKITAEGLTGQGMPKRDLEFILVEIEWLLEYTKTHDVKNLTGLYRTTLIEGYGNESKLVPKVLKIGSQDLQQTFEKNLAEQRKLDKQRQKDEAKREHVDSLQEVIDNLSPDEYDNLKQLAIESMPQIDRARYMRSHSKFTLDRYMRSAYEKLMV